jgi:purine-binding chemotaxis protein CheW
LQQDEIMSQVSTALESPRRELLSFRLAEQEFCVDIMAVREIRGWTEATPLPRAPDYIRGMINLRGTVFPVVDMNVRFGLPANDLANRKVIIVVWIDTRLVGLLVDAVCDIIAVTDAELQPTSELAGEAIRSLVTAVLTVENRMLCLITLNHLLPELGEAAA